MTVKKFFNTYIWNILFLYTNLNMKCDCIIILCLKYNIKIKYSI